MASEREAAHEDSDDRCDGEVRIADHPAQHSRPQNLVEQTGGAGEKEAA